VPWLNLALIFAVVYVASPASTLLPAVRASRVYPAEALRYE
jgi:ABC-type lipoprotein release transport system permease subunit